MKILPKFVLFILLVISSKTGFSQVGSQTSVSSVFKINFFMPGISYEQKITNNQTLHLAAFMDAAFLSQTTNDNTEFKVLFSPTCSAAFRSYYNIKKRYQKGFNTSSNSANYFAPVYMGRYPLSSEFTNHEWVNQVGAIWGLQRTAAKGFSLDLSLGLAYTFDSPDLSYYNPIEPIIQLAIGFRLGPA